jgi:hypothetical protein
METIYRDERWPHVEIRWAGGATFNIWVEGDGRPYYHSENGWTNTDCFTHYAGKHGERSALTPSEARDIAEEHFNEMAHEEGLNNG